MTAGGPLQTRIAISVGAELRRLRERAGLTQGEVARRSGTHRPIVGRTEAGRHCPTLEVAVLQAEVCGGSVDNVARAIADAVEPRAARPRRVSVRASGVKATT